MSGPFGWDYPPGCNSTPYDEDQVIDLEPYLTKLGVNAVGYWTEDGTIHAGVKYEDEGYLPKVADLVWDDDLSEEQNAQAASAIIARLYQVDNVRRLKLHKRLSRAIAKARAKRDAQPVPTFAEWLASINAPDGDFVWDNDDPGDAHVWCCGERDCEQQWHKSYYNEEIGRKAGKAYVTIRSGDDDGNWDIDDGYDEADESRPANAKTLCDPDPAWASVWRSMEGRIDDYFTGWAEYHLECAQTHRDPSEAFYKAEDGASSTKHLDAAEDMIDYLDSVSNRTRKVHRMARAA